MAVEPVLEPVGDPEWFRGALDQRSVADTIRCDGATVHYRSWGPRTGDGVVLVHGAAAHSGWWDHVAPLLAPGRRVVAFDLSGHGRSDRRREYGIDGWAGEVQAVARATGLYRPTVVGHSMGGVVALATALDEHADLGPVIALDSIVRTTSRTATAWAAGSVPPLRTYATRADAVRHFRTVPAQPAVLAYVLEHIAATSVHAVPGGWSWRFDPQIFRHARFVRDRLAALHRPVTLVRAEFGIVGDDVLAAMLAASGEQIRVAPLPGAHHHMMIDKPLETIEVIRRLIG